MLVMSMVFEWDSAFLTRLHLLTYWNVSERIGWETSATVAKQDVQAKYCLSRGLKLYYWCVGVCVWGGWGGEQNVHAHRHTRHLAFW